jgi:hypothetical protein
VERAWVWGSTALVAAVLFVACGGGDSSDSAERPAARSTTTVSAEDLDMQPDDFPNINTLTPVGNHFVGNLLGHLDEALAVANSPDGGEYPVGTLIQLVPQEAMVKRRAGWNAASNDWEFFSLDATAAGTEILTRGATPVLNRFGMDCLACHGKADAQWDMVCDENHGCDPLGLDQQMIVTLQSIDPRPRN